MENVGAADKTNMTLKKEHKRKRDKYFNMGESSRSEKIDAANADSRCDNIVFKTVADTVVFPHSIMQEGSSVEVFSMDDGQHVWLPGSLRCLEGPKALVHFNDTDANGEQHWFIVDSTINMSNQANDNDVPTADGDYSFPRVRPSMDVAHLPEEILFAKHNEAGEILRAGKVVETWNRDRWVEGEFVGFSSGGVLVKLSAIAEVVALKPHHVRLPPLWIAEEKSWQIMQVKVQMQELPEVVMNRRGKAPAPKAKVYLSKKTPNSHPKHLISAHQYATRSSLMASLVVAWSPMLQLSPVAPDNSCDCYSLLAVGTKSGNISIWRIHRPPYYSAEHCADPTKMILVGVLEAHNAWVTALSWSLLASDSRPQVLLASGCSDGSVKIWLGCGNHLKNLSEANHSPFSLFSEVTAGDNVLVSALSLFVPAQSSYRILLAVGKGSGSFEVWTCNTKRKISKKVGSYDAHVQVVTGLAWAFDGHCLYSCSQDNSMRGWVYHKGSLSEVSIPPNNLGIKSSSDLPSASDSCYGVAVSPGNLALAVARRFDAGQLDHMYQKRTQRAAVEFFWIGGQQVDISATHFKVDIEACLDFSKEELGCWGSKLLWSLTQYVSHDKHLVIWDTLAALLAFKQCASEFIKHLALRLLELLFEAHWDPSTKDILSDVSRYVSNISTRRLHLLNILCRRVMISSDLKSVKVSAKPPNLAESYSTEEEQRWMDLMVNSENELRERLVGFNLSTVLGHMSHLAPKAEGGSWKPVGVAQMVKWVSENHNTVCDQLNVLASKVGRLAARLPAVCEYEAEEKCSYCSAAVPFESPEIAVCQGVKSSEDEAPQKHKLARCAVSMQVCPLTPLWFCMCCQRRASKLPPRQLFTMPNYPSDFTSYVKPSINDLLPTSLCPFCGISLQRLQPDFLLSPSPV